jgi:dTDP-L-rhamnose 4-epimerase
VDAQVNVLVTGGAGFVGRHLVSTLVVAGYSVRVLDSLSEQIHGSSATPPRDLAGAEFVHGDVRDTDCLASALVGIDAVVHLAAETGVGQSMYEVERYDDANDRGTACLLQGLLRCQRPVRVVLASSRAVYGEGLYSCQRCGEVSPPPRNAIALGRGAWDPVCPVCGGTIHPRATHEAAVTEPGSVYAATKLAQEHLCRILGNAYGMSWVILRYFNVYGPGQSLSNPYTGILSTFHARATHGNPIEVYEDGRESRDFVFIDDVVEATCRALLHTEDLPHGLVLNVGTGVPVSIMDLARALVRIGGWHVPIRVTGGYRLGDVRHSFADTQRAQHVLGFAAATSLDEGLRQWLAWAEGRDEHDATDVALEHLAARGLYRTTEIG